jgi:glucose-6-phosphate 1-epimerase
MNRQLPKASSSQIDTLLLGELACWRIRHADAELVISQQGAQVLSYQPAGQAPLIWLSEQATYQRGQSVRGGVPVCWPWFGDLSRNPPAVQTLVPEPSSAPFHGGVRTLDWQLQLLAPDADGISLEFRCPAPTSAANWPAALELELHIRLDQRLSISLISHNSGSQPLTISQALHSYFAVSDIRQVEVEGLAGCRYIETLEDWQTRQQSGPLSFSGETDRIYQELPSILSIRDPGWQRRLCLESHGSRSAVLWNPWIDKAQRLSSFAADAWQQMLCIETANVWDDCVQLAAGASHNLGVTLWSEPL